MICEHLDDPHVERLLQSFALMYARHDIRLEGGMRCRSLRTR
ncbi:type VI secretion system baseplate subunit TssF [Burkholderia anthina]|nr:type VI secretion system baseplate subunit TssF [Burkholderia anthina]